MSKPMTQEEHHALSRKLWEIAERFNEAWEAANPDAYAGCRVYYVREFEQKAAQLIQKSQDYLSPQ